MRGLISVWNKAVEVCKLVPMLPIAIVAAIPVAAMWDLRPWGEPFWIVDPSLGQWIVILLVAYTLVCTIRGMIDDIRQGHVGVDVLAVVAQLATIAVGEYWAAWVIVVMVNSGEAIEAYAAAKAESSLTALMEGAPHIAHVAELPGVGPDADGSHAASRSARHGDSGAAGGTDDSTDVASGGAPRNRTTRADRAADGFRGIPRQETLSESQAASLDHQAANAHFNTVPVEQVRLGDVLIVLPGETVPVDGELLSGSATLDLSNINGEPVPREVYAGARVMSGAVNGSTTLTMRATELARDSQYQRILELVSSAQNSRATVVKTADLFAVPFTVISFIIAGLAWFISADPSRFAQVLVLATPCPLLIAAPVAYIAGTGRLAKAGILIKTQEVLENLGRVSHIFFDKTGTLTVKKPQVVRVEMARDMKATGATAAAAANSADAANGTDAAGAANTADVVGSAGAAVGAAASQSAGVTGAAGPVAANGATAPVNKAGVADGAVASRNTPVAGVAGSAGAAGSAAAAPMDADHVLMYAGVVESYSVHILAKGIATAGTAVIERLKRNAADGRPLPREDEWLRERRSYPVVRNVSEESGKGVVGEVNGHIVRVGRFAFVTGALDSTDKAGNGSVETDAPSAGKGGKATAGRRDGFRATRRPHAAKPATAPDVASPANHFGAMAADEMGTYVSIDGVLAARIVLKDVPRANAKESLSRLREMGVERLTMLTGDKRASAEIIAAEVGIDDVHAELLPEDKLNAIERARRQMPETSPWWDRMLSRFTGESLTRSVTMMVGDGVNDAPVLAAADIGMAITDGTSTAASESAQVVIMNDDIAAVPRAINISRRTKRVMLQAVCVGLGLALIGMVCAAFNLIPAFIGAIMQEVIDVVSIGWALTALLDRD